MQPQCVFSDFRVDVLRHSEYLVSKTSIRPYRTGLEDHHHQEISSVAHVTLRGEEECVGARVISATDEAPENNQSTKPPGIGIPLFKVK